MIILENVRRSFKGEEVLKGVNLTFNSSEVSSIVAPNGSGKTTLISIISNLMYPTEGKVVFQNGFNRKDIFLILSGERNLYMKNTVYENIVYFCTLRGLSKKEIKATIDKNADKFPLYSKIESKLCEELSFGQKRLVAIFAAIVSGARCIILDEPSEGLDFEHLEMVKGIISGMKKDKIVILTSHNYEFIAELSDKTMFLKDGKIVKESDELNKETLMEIYTDLYGGAVV